MKFTSVWISLSLVGIGALVGAAHEALAQEATAIHDESIARRRISQVEDNQAKHSSQHIRRIEESSSNNKHTANGNISGLAFASTSGSSETDNASNKDNTNINSLRHLQDEDEWFQAVLLKAVAGSFSMPTTPAPTKSPVSGPPSSFVFPTAEPTSSPTTPSPIDAPSTSPPATAPSQSPTTQAPTTTPTETPTGGLTVAPTFSVPTTSPTQQPANTAPTGAPADVPTTAAPSLSIPTAAPGPVCEVEVEISCVWDVDGVTDCKDIPVPGACSAEGIDLSNVASGVPLSSISFLYDYSPCPTSLTLQRQPEEFSCVDEGTPSTSTFEAQIACFDEDMNELVDSTFSAGQFVLLQAATGSDLGQVVRCEISEVSTGDSGEQVLNRLQEMRITTAVFGNFYLLDRYGSFLVESCDAQRCVEPVQYSYSITNVQAEAQTITELLRDRNGDAVSLLSLVPDGELSQEPGDVTVVSEDGGLNVCLDATIDTSITVRAEPEDGPVCQGSDEYSVLVEVECRIDVDIKCETEAGEECKALDFPRESCAANGDGIRDLRLVFESRTCEVTTPTNSQGDLATCRDFTMPFDRVHIVCTDGDATDATIAMSIESGEVDVGEGETILLTTSATDGSLPNTVSCQIRSSVDPAVIYQVVSFDTSASVDLNLRDQFGSLQVEACSTATSSLDCLVTVCLEYVIQNVGTNDADVVDLTRTLLGETENIFGLLSDTALSSGQSSEAIEKVLIDRCSDEEYCVTSLVEAAGSNGLVCEDEDDYCLGSSPGGCEIGLDMICQTVDEGFSGSCTGLQGEQFLQCSCTECPNELIFRYTGAPCSDITSPGLLACLDESAIPSEGALVVVTSGDDELFRGTVDNGEEIGIVQGGGCLPAELMIVVSGPNATAASQVVTIGSSCSEEGITLLDSLGAVQFSGYTCTEDSIPHNCFVDARFDIVATNTGQGDQTLSTFQFTFDGVTSNLLEDVVPEDLELGPSQNFTASEFVVLERCTESEYLASSTAQGNEGECAADAEIMIGPILPGTPSPTTSPIEAPTTAGPLPGSPTVAPSPTASPIEAPTTASPVSGSPMAASPTVAPTPSESPVVAPPTDGTPTESPAECILEVQTECTPPPGSETCEEIRAAPVLCEGRPELMLLLFEGGDCQNSFNAQSGPLFTCEDFNGGPPTQFDSSSYVVITDIRGAGTVYFNGWVEVGELIALSAPGDDAVFEANQNITIYNSNMTGPESIVQTTVFHTSCSDSPSSQSLFLKDRFGSMQVVGFDNQEQGSVSCFVEAGIEVSITVPTSVTGQPITISAVQTRISAVPGGEETLLNNTDVEGLEITSDDDPLFINLSLALNLTTRRTYSVFTTVAGVTEDGRECEGSDLYQFSAGQPPPPLFPTIAPTEMPTRSIQPSPDPENTPCDLTAILTCVVIRGGSNTCVGLQNPSDVTCTGDMSPSLLSFQYTGDRCPVNPQNYECADTALNTGARETVFVEITEGERIIGTADVRLNEFVSAQGEYGAETTITIYTFDNGVRGEVLQTLNIPTACDPDDDLTLLNQYGSLELTGFTNAASGEQGIEAQIELIYGVENSGFQSAEVQSALIIDAFDGGPIEIVENPFILESGALEILFRNEQILNLRLKEQLGRTDTFFLSVQGSSVSNDIDCTDTAQLSF